MFFSLKIYIVFHFSIFLWFVFCSSYTAEHLFHRIENEYAFSASNAFKVDTLHALIGLKQHDPLRWSPQSFMGLMNLSVAWWVTLDVGGCLGPKMKFWEGVHFASSSVWALFIEGTVWPVARALSTSQNIAKSILRQKPKVCDLWILHHQECVYRAQSMLGKRFLEVWDKSSPEGRRRTAVRKKERMFSAFSCVCFVTFLVV